VGRRIEVVTYLQKGRHISFLISDRERGKKRGNFRKGDGGIKREGKTDSDRQTPRKTMK
jgi:hypothetical protein